MEAIMKRDERRAMARAGDARHPFERSGFGAGPYTFKGSEETVYKPHPDVPAKPGTSCDYCGTGIMMAFWFRSADGVNFKVGCDCMLKASKESKDYPLQTLAVKLKRKHDCDIRHAREAAKLRELDQFVSERAEWITTLPHPYKHHADQGRTMADYVAWMMRNAGTAGKLGILRELKTMAAA